MKKRCASCKKLKVVGEFYNHSKTKDGKQSRCKECDHKSASEWRKRNRAYMRNYIKGWAKENKDLYLEHQRKASKKYNKKYPEKTAARNAVHYLIRKGKLTHMACEVCGNFLSEAHHHDYLKPTDIWWLCKKHHRLANRGELVLYG